MARITPISTVLLLTLLVSTYAIAESTAASPTTARPTLSVEVFRTVILARRQYIPSESVVVDKCTLENVLSSSQIDSLYSEIRHSTQMNGCGYEADLSGTEVHWKYSGALDFPHEITIAADIRKPYYASLQRETYVIAGSSVKVTLSHFGIVD